MVSPFLNVRHLITLFWVLVLAAGQNGGAELPLCAPDRSAYTPKYATGSVQTPNGPQDAAPPYCSKAQRVLVEGLDLQPRGKRVGRMRIAECGLRNGEGGFRPMTLTQRLKGAFQLVVKGSVAPFNQIPDLGGASSGDKLTQPMRKSTWVQRAIKIVALPCTDVPLTLSTDMRGGTEVVTDPRMISYWEAPALGPDKRPLSWADTVETTIIWLKLAGECFWLLDDTVLIPASNMPFPEAGRTVPRFIIGRPDRMREITSTIDNSLLGWEWTDGGRRKHFLLPEQVVHLRYPNPYNDYRGLSEYEACQVAAEADYLGGVFKKNVMAANGDQGPIIGVKSPLDDIQRKQLELQLREKRQLATQGIYKTLILGSDITVEDPKIKVVDSSFPAVRSEDRHEIFVAFGVPPSMCEVMASYSIGSASDWYRLIRDTCIPTGRKLTEAVESVVRLTAAVHSMGAAAGDNKTGQIYAWLDWRQHAVMRQVLRELIDPATKMWDRGMPWESINQWLGLDLPDFEGWDQGYLPFSVAPAEQAGLDPAADPNFQEPTDPAAGEKAGKPESGKASEQLRALFNGRAGAAAPPMHLSCGCSSADQPQQRGRPAAEVALWRKHMTARRGSVKRFESAISRALMAARAETLRKIEAAWPTRTAARSAAAALETRSTAADFLFSLDDLTANLKAATRKASILSLKDAGQQLFAEIGVDDPFKFPPEKALVFLSQRENKLANAPIEVWNQVKEKIETGLNEGQSITEMAREIRDEFNDIGKGRAKTIAMTETAAAYGAARQEAMDQSGVPFKKWLTSGAANVRAAHAEANGQVVPVDEPFEVGGEALDGPGDPTGSPGNVINCHCVAIAVSNEDGEVV